MAQHQITYLLVEQSSWILCRHGFDKWNPSVTSFRILITIRVDPGITDKFSILCRHATSTCMLSSPCILWLYPFATILPCESTTTAECLHLTSDKLASSIRLSLIFSWSSMVMAIFVRLFDTTRIKYASYDTQPFCQNQSHAFTICECLDWYLHDLMKRWWGYLWSICCVSKNASKPGHSCQPTNSLLSMMRVIPRVVPTFQECRKYHIYCHRCVVSRKACFTKNNIMLWVPCVMSGGRNIIILIRHHYSTILYPWCLFMVMVRHTANNLGGAARTPRDTFRR